MDRFQVMNVFVAVAEEQSFAAAARRLGMSPPAVTRAIASLEARLGIKLLSRTTRFVRASDAGLRYLDSARRILAEADEADEAAAGVHALPRGKLTVTAPVLFGRQYVMPGVVEYLQRYPEVSVSMLCLDRIVNLLEEGLDVGVRIGELPDSSLHAIAVGQVCRVVCAAPAYLKRHGTPKVPQDLARHALIAASPLSPSSEWRLGSGKSGITLKLKPQLTVNNNAAAIEAATLGFGITRLMSYQVAPYLQSGQLKRVLATHDPCRCRSMSSTAKVGRRRARCALLSICWWIACARIQRLIRFETGHARYQFLA
jgi:transcriptional regulator, LysR family